MTKENRAWLQLGIERTKLNLHTQSLVDMILETTPMALVFLAISDNVKRYANGPDLKDNPRERKVWLEYSEQIKSMEIVQSYINAQQGE